MRPRTKSVGMGSAMLDEIAFPSGITRSGPRVCSQPRRPAGAPLATRGFYELLPKKAGNADDTDDADSRGFARISTGSIFRLPRKSASSVSSAFRVFFFGR